jgi:hypothetical protein
MQGFYAVGSWGARRLLKALLKNKLAQILATDLDLAQIDVQLRKGSLELKDCLLDSKYLNEQLVSQMCFTLLQFLKVESRLPHRLHRSQLPSQLPLLSCPNFTSIPLFFQVNDLYEIESALIGKISVNLFDLRIVLEGVDIVVKQQDLVTTGPAQPRFNGETPSFGAPDPLYNENEAQFGAETSVDGGIPVLVSLIRLLLKNLHGEARGILVRAKLADGQFLTMNLDSIAVKDAQGTTENELNAACNVTKACSFSGLAGRLTPSESSTEVLASLSWETTGCSGKIVAGWTVDELNSPVIDLKPVLDGVCVWMSPAAVPVISDLLETFRSWRAHMADQHHNNMSDNPLSKSLMVTDAASLKDFQRALMLPDGERLMQEAHAEEVRGFCLSSRFEVVL